MHVYVSLSVALTKKKKEIWSGSSRGDERRHRRPVIVPRGAQRSQCVLDPGKEPCLVDFKHTAPLCHLSDAEPALFSESVRCPIAKTCLHSASGTSRRPERRISADLMYSPPLAPRLVLSCTAWGHTCSSTCVVCTPFTGKQIKSALFQMTCLRSLSIS